MINNLGHIHEQRISQRPVVNYQRRIEGLLIAPKVLFDTFGSTAFTAEIRLRDKKPPLREAAS